MKHIVKRAGHSEPYDNHKLYASIYAAALAVREPQGSAELIAQEVTKSVDAWLNNKHEVTSHDIHTQAQKHLQPIHPDAAYIYKTQKCLH